MVKLIEKTLKIKGFLEDIHFYLPGLSVLLSCMSYCNCENCHTLNISMFLCNWACFTFCILSAGSIITYSWAFR